jgi:hypothetical protein
MDAGITVTVVTFEKETDKVTLSSRDQEVRLTGASWQATINSLRHWVGLLQDEFNLVVADEGRSVVYGQFPQRLVLDDIQIRAGIKLGTGVVTVEGSREDDTVEISIMPRPLIVCNLEQLIGFIRLSQLHLTALIDFEKLHPENM